MTRRLHALACALLVALPAVAAADFADHWANPDDVGRKKSPRRGRSRVAVLPLEIGGVSQPLDLAQLHEFFESEERGGFRSYWREQSLGTLALEAQVLPVVRYESCPLDPEKYPRCRIARGDLSAAADGIALLGDALRRADEAGLDLTEYDTNGPGLRPDGVADGVVVVTNAPFGGIAVPIFDLNQGDDLAGGVGGSFLVDGIEIPVVAVAGDHLVAVHEFGHVLGMTDLYNEDGTAHGVQWSLMGDWSYTSQIPQLDAPSRVAMGWANVRAVHGQERIRLAPVEERGEVVKLGSGTEFFLVENRGPGPIWDRQMTARGLAVYHVDWAKGPDGQDGGYLLRVFECVECDVWHPFIMNVQADGLFELQHHRGGRDEEGDLFLDGDELRPDPSGVPLGEAHAVLSSNRYDGSPTAIELFDVRADGDGGEVSFTAVAPLGDPCEGVRCPAGESCASGGCAVPAQASWTGPAAPAARAQAAEEEGCSQAGGAPGGLCALAALFGLALARRRRGTPPTPA